MSFLGMDIGWSEILIILIVALVVVGPEKLPYYARKGAKFIRNVQKVTGNLTGQISKAINLDDDEGGQASSLKKDLLSVKKSLEKDVAELKTTFDEQARSVSKTLDASTKEARESFKKDAREISGALSAEAAELKTALDQQAKTVSETVSAGVNDAATSLAQSTAGVKAAVVSPVDAPAITAPVEKAPLPVEPAAPPPPIIASEAEISS